MPEIFYIYIGLSIGAGLYFHFQVKDLKKQTDELKKIVTLTKLPYDESRAETPKADQPELTQEEKEKSLSRLQEAEKNLEEIKAEDFPDLDKFFANQSAYIEEYWRLNRKLPPGY